MWIDYTRGQRYLLLSTLTHRMQDCLCDAAWKFAALRFYHYPAVTGITFYQDVMQVTRHYFEYVIAYIGHHIFRWSASPILHTKKEDLVTVVRLEGFDIVVYLQATVLLPII